MNLTEHFTLNEFTLSGTAIRHGWENKPNELDIHCMVQLCIHVLEPLRRRFGMIRITSGYRSRQVNNAVGGVEFSQHTRGQAADIFVPNHEIGKKMYEFIRTQTVFDQLIYEVDAKTNRQWIHVSYNEENNRCQSFMNYEVMHRKKRLDEHFS